MHRAIAIIVTCHVGHPHAEELVATHTTDTLDHLDVRGGTLIDNLVDELAKPELKVWPAHHAYRDTTLLGKPGQLGILHGRPYMSNPTVAANAMIAPHLSRSISSSYPVHFESRRYRRNDYVTRSRSGGEAAKVVGIVGLAKKYAGIALGVLATLKPPTKYGIAYFTAGVAVGYLVKPVVSTFQRWQTADDIPNTLLKKQGYFNGVVASVTDGDTIRVRHTPFFRRSGTFKGKASEATIVIRIGAVDTPETKKFGNPGQPFGQEAKDFAKRVLLNPDGTGKRITVKALAKDQYSRVVGMVYYGGWGPFKENLSKKLLEEGLAQVYQQMGGQYDGEKEEYERIEAKAKKSKKGLWSQKNFESAAEYKARIKKEKGE